MSNTRTRRTTPSKAAPPAERRGFPIWWIAGGLVAVALIGAILLSMGGGGEAGEFGDPEITGQALPAFTDPAADPAVGMPIPRIEGTSFDGSAVTIEPPGEGALAIAFLAHWCGHCQNEVPAVQAWLDAGGAEGLDVKFLSVATATSAARDNFPPSAWLEREGWTVPVLADDTTGSVGDAYGLTAFPYWVIADADGNVTARYSGSLPIAGLEALLAAANG